MHAHCGNHLHTQPTHRRGGFAARAMPRHLHTLSATLLCMCVHTLLCMCVHTLNRNHVNRAPLADTILVALAMCLCARVCVPPRSRTKIGKAEGPRQGWRPDGGVRCVPCHAPAPARTHHDTHDTHEPAPHATPAPFCSEQLLTHTLHTARRQAATLPHDLRPSTPPSATFPHDLRPHPALHCHRSVPVSVSVYVSTINIDDQ